MLPPPFISAMARCAPARKERAFVFITPEELFGFAMPFHQVLTSLKKVSRINAVTFAASLLAKRAAPQDAATAADSRQQQLLAMRNQEQYGAIWRLFKRLQDRILAMTIHLVDRINDRNAPSAHRWTHREEL